MRLLRAKSVLEDGLNEKFLFIGIYFISKNGLQNFLMDWWIKGQRQSEKMIQNQWQ